MREEGFVRALLFIILFSFGAAGLGLAVLADKLADYYHNRARLQMQKDRIEQLKQLNADYDEVIEQLENDPNVFERLGPAILGQKPNEPNTVYPQAPQRQVETTKQMLKKHIRGEPEKPVLPEWLKRVTEPKRRTALLLAGGFLILISFMLFARRSSPPEEDSVES